MSIITVGTDLAKNAFAVHRADDIGKAALIKSKVSLHTLLERVAACEPQPVPRWLPQNAKKKGAQRAPLTPTESLQAIA